MADTEGNVATTWARIETWARANMPGLIAELAPPASREDISRLEKWLGFPLPADFVESLLVHNGEDGDGKLLDSSMGLLSVESIGDYTKRDRKQIGHRTFGMTFSPGGGITFDASDDEFDAERTIGPVRAQHYHPGRAVVADFNGDIQLLVDLAPADGGTSGQVLYRDVENGELEVVAPSWSAFLRDYADKLEQGRTDFDPETAEERRQPPAVDPVREAQRKRFHAAIKKQSKTVDLPRTPDGTRVELVGCLGYPHGDMGPDDYVFQVYGHSMTVKAPLGITREQIGRANAAGELFMFRVKGIYHPRRFFQFALPKLDLESFEWFEGAPTVPPT